MISYLKILVLLMIFNVLAARGQITSVNPASAPQGTTGLTVTFTLDSSAMPPVPPSGVMPRTVTLGSISGTSFDHSSQYTVTAEFDIPGDEAVGAKDACITFLTPQNTTLEYTLAGAFTVTGGSDMPPKIYQQPQSQVVRIGRSAAFTVGAWSTGPLAYQWYKDDVEIPGAESASYTITSTAQSDVGNYKCIVTNDFGSDTSEIACLTVNTDPLPESSYPIVDTGQVKCYDNNAQITAPAFGDAFYGQDAQVNGNQPSYTVSNDGLTVYDNVTGLTWTRTADINNDGAIDVDDKLTSAEAMLYPDVLNAVSFGGYKDWRLPTIKELYSLMNFTGEDPSGYSGDTSGLVPFIDDETFGFGYGDESAGERIIDAQWASSTMYVSTTMNGNETMFGLNLADGRIKGYPTNNKLYYVYFVRGNTDYGVNNFVDNSDGTITDKATGLMWSQDDCGAVDGTGPWSGMNWQDALAWVQAQNSQSYCGYSDWRLPNAKEMQSIVQYTRSPDTTNSAAIDPIFNVTQITNEAGEVDFPWYWTGTTHANTGGQGQSGAYICFGKGLGYWTNVWQDVHGAGCQRSDPKSGDPADYPTGHGPQGDAIRIYNYVRLVRDVQCGQPGYVSDLPGDMNDDCKVDFFDMANFCGGWQRDYDLSALTKVAENWLN